MTVKGNVTDSSGNPISDIEIKTVSTTYRLGIDLTDTNGDFDFVSVASNRTEFDIWVNAKSWSDSQFYQEDYGSILYHFKNRDLGNSFILDTIQLHPKATLNIEVSSSATDTISFVLKYKSPELHYFVNTDDYISPYNYSSQNLLPGMPDYSKSNSTLQGTEATLTYRINSGEEQEIIIPINQPTTTYVLSY